MGEMTHGHHQIAMECSACHTDPFGGKEILQNACVDCHGEELSAVRDSHPKSKFTNPRNADRIEKLDARFCIACHVEHRLDKTNAMGVTLPNDFCFECHQEIGEERPSHAGMGFETCASAGCHNFHDNQALYEDFLLEHANEPMFAEVAKVLARNAQDYRKTEATPLTADDADGVVVNQEITSHWLGSAHAEAGVNCSGCHASETQTKNWVQHPDHQVCANCHEQETAGFLAGKHGMKMGLGLPPMRVAEARIPMHPEAAHKSLSCSSCHEPHRVDTQYAAVEACSSCHASTHVQNFKASPHAQIAVNKPDAEEEQVTCATCHMPRTVAPNGRVSVEHNQNANLRPNEKMIRGVCMDCHSLSFSIDALADPELIERNFSGRPSVHIPSIEMSLERDKKHSEKASVYN
ncbi:cytochrome c3 family protein [Spongiibacter pelagi]|nr:cytochrome c3 family protein [Spongiibacter pelagi]